MVVLKFSLHPKKYWHLFLMSTPAEKKTDYIWTNSCRLSNHNKLEFHRNAETVRQHADMSLDTVTALAWNNIRTACSRSGFERNAIQTPYECWYLLRQAIRNAQFMTGILETWSSEKSTAVSRRLPFASHGDTEILRKLISVISQSKVKSQTSH
jgi:hypothetical protein